MWPVLIILSAVLLSTGAAGAEGEASEPPPLFPGLGDNADADAVLEQVVARLPREPLQIAGEFKADPRDGRPARRCQVQVRIDYGATPAQARFTIMDAFGEDLEQMTLFRSPDGTASWHYARGYPLVPASLPDTRAPLQGTDLTWSDLSLSFLWWRGGRLAGTEKTLDRDCLVLVVPAPAGEPAPYAQARLWIDRRQLMLLRAEGCDAAGTPLTRLAVKSIKKIDDDWMVKDLDVTTLATGLRTSLRIDSVDKLPAGGAAR